MSDTILIDRRKVIGGLAAIAVAPSLFVKSMAQTRNQDPAIKPLENPIPKYPKPPFKIQDQPWPGLAKKMDPVPDHGEKTYKGSGRLQAGKH